MCHVRCRGKTSHRLPVLADMQQTAVTTSEARDEPAEPRSGLADIKLQLKPKPGVPPSRGFRWAPWCKAS